MHSDDWASRPDHERDFGASPASRRMWGILFGLSLVVVGMIVGSVIGLLIVGAARLIG